MMIINIAQKTHLKFASTCVQMSQVPPDELRLSFLVFLFFLEHQLLMNLEVLKDTTRVTTQRRRKVANRQVAKSTAE